MSFKPLPPVFNRAYKNHRAAFTASVKKGSSGSVRVSMHVSKTTMVHFGMPTSCTVESGEDEHSDQIRITFDGTGPYAIHRLALDSARLSFPLFGEIPDKNTENEICEDIEISEKFAIIRLPIKLWIEKPEKPIPVFAGRKKAAPSTIPARQAEARPSPPGFLDARTYLQRRGHEYVVLPSKKIQFDREIRTPDELLKTINMFRRKETLPQLSLDQISFGNE